VAMSLAVAAQIAWGPTLLQGSESGGGVLPRASGNDRLAAGPWIRTWRQAGAGARAR